MITIVVGAQYGGEGKGKICAYLAKIEKADVSCRCGGPNSSHTVVHAGREVRLRMMPAAAAVNRRVDVYFGPGTLIHVDTLFREIEELDFDGRLYIDPKAGIITENIVEQQRADSRYSQIGSTLTGTGLASALRAQRKLQLAREFPAIATYIRDTGTYLAHDIRKKKRVLIEGHQGYGLSNYHGDYPFTSSRDSTAASMLAELGLGPLQRSMRVVLVAKLFPTRNHAGSLAGEMPEEEAQQRGINEFGGGAWGIPNRRRRVGTFDLDLVQRAIFANTASEIAFTGADYLDVRLRGARNTFDLWRSSALAKFVTEFQRKVRAVPVRYISTGPDTLETIDISRDPPDHQARQESNNPGLFPLQ